MFDHVQAALKFHHLREQKPQLFFSRLVNKMWYGFLGAQDLWKRSCVNLPTSLKVSQSDEQAPYTGQQCRHTFGQPVPSSEHNRVVPRTAGPSWV